MQTPIKEEGTFAVERMRPTGLIKMKRCSLLAEAKWRFYITTKEKNQLRLRRNWFFIEAKLALGYRHKRQLVEPIHR